MSKLSFVQLFAFSLALVNQGQYSESKVAGLAIGTGIGPIGQIDIIGVTPSNQATDFETNWESGDYIVSSIAIKTGTVQSAESHCAAMLEICDHDGKCCNTSSNLNNPGLDRGSGKIDKYTEQSLLGSCAQKVRNICKINIKDKSSQGKLRR